MRWFPAALVAGAGRGADVPDAAGGRDLRRLEPGELIDSLGEPGALDALWLSLRTTAIALAIIVVVGTPAAYLLATRSFRGKALLVTLVELPLVLPPAVAGIALLAAVGPERHARRRRSRRRRSSSSLDHRRAWSWR